MLMGGDRSGRLCTGRVRVTHKETATAEQEHRGHWVRAESAENVACESGVAAYFAGETRSVFDVRVASMMLFAALAAGFVVFVSAYVFFVQPIWGVSLLERLTPQVLYRVRTAEPLVALSFDDGPHPVYTPEVLEILRRHGARATFFLIGDRAERHPELVSAIRADGHEVGNHYLYYRHGLMLAHSDEEFVKHLEDVERVLGIPAGRDAKPKMFRAPGGLARPRQLALARERGYTCALGCAYPHDPGHPPVAYMRWLVEKNLAPGTIVILHDGIPDPSRSIEALRRILEEGARRGLTFVSIGELVEMGAANDAR
jgi:peptidoglycan-N-acetylglucosamine deacetylase